MVCHGPDPPENDPYELTPPPRNEVTVGIIEDSDEDNDHIGYEPLPQGPDTAVSDHDSEDEAESTNATPANDVPPIEAMDVALIRNVWNAPRSVDPIQMDVERQQQVMTAMANFALPHTSIPEWAQSITEEQWKQTLSDKIERLKNNT